jgi:hypothetical protein
MAGGSHTNFDTAAFGVGAIGGAATIAGALGAGIRNFQAQRQATWLSWTWEQLRAALELSEAFRAHERQQLQAAVDTIADRDRTIAEITRQLRTEQARNRRR